MEKIIALVRPNINVKHLSAQFQGELIRKSLHLLIAFVPLMASVNLSGTMLILALGTLFYVFAEKLRLEGRRVYIISDLTVIASREMDRGHFVLGPVTLGVGAMLALLLYPSAAAAIAIYALAFGDGLASIAGKVIGKLRIPLTRGKTAAGCLACFIAVFLCTLRLTGSLRTSLIIALAATVIESLPLRDFDNLLLPVGTGFLAAKLLFIN